MPQLVGNACNSNRYPQDEDRIVRQLVRLIAEGKTWQDITDASDAIFHVQIQAKSMRVERDSMAKQADSIQAQSIGAQARNPAAWINS